MNSNVGHWLQDYITIDNHFLWYIFSFEYFYNPIQTSSQVKQNLLEKGFMTAAKNWFASVVHKLH